MPLTYIYILTIGISVISGLLSWHQPSTDRPFIRKFTLFLLLTFLIEIAGAYTSAYRIGNAALFNGYVIIEFILISYFFRSVIHSYRFGKYINIFYILFPTVILINNILHQDFFNVFQANIYLLGSFHVIICCIFYLYEQFFLISNLEEQMSRKPMFWISTGMLFFFAASFLIMGSINILIVKDINFIRLLYQFQIFFNIIMYLLFSIGLSCQKIFKKSVYI